jgi:hypothetical protein
MKQLDLFRKTKKISESPAKYERTLSMGTLKRHTWKENLLRIDIYCQCKRYLKIHYELIQPVKKIGWTINSIEEYKRDQNVDEFFCPHCRGKLYIMNAKVKIIEI